ncbi:hypothetical protein DAI22_01g145800 [Oryza sativa Japonica Group]|nr:hypothetical protein DAI22_01g145800 [Oryza sativa Japonica Group]
MNSVGVAVDLSIESFTTVRGKRSLDSSDNLLHTFTVLLSLSTIIYLLSMGLNLHCLHCKIAQEKPAACFCCHLS